MNVLNDNPKLNYFLERYGGQIIHLELPELSIPVSTKGEVDLYRQLPKLKRPEVDCLIEEDDNEQEILCPQVFKKLETLTILFYKLQHDNSQERFSKLLEKLIKYCKNLNKLGFPYRSLKFNTFKITSGFIQNLLQSTLTTINVRDFATTIFLPPGATSRFSVPVDILEKLSRKYKINFQDICTDTLSLDNKTHLDQILPYINDLYMFGVPDVLRELFCRM